MLVLDGDSNGDGSGNDYAFIQHNTDGEIQIENYKSASIRFATAGIDRYKIDASGHLLPAADSTYNIGSNSVRVANGYFDTLYGDGSNLTGISSVGGANSVSFNDNVRAKFGNGNDLEIYHDGSNSYIKEVGTGNLQIQSANVIEIESDTGEKCARFHPDGAVELYHDNSKKFETGSYGCQVTGLLQVIGNVAPSANNTYDLGTTSERWRNIYTNDLNLSNEGGANDVDSTWGSFTIQEGHHDLFLINKRNGKKYKFNLTEVS